MTSDPAKHRRRSIRLKGYDYSQEGAYFVTVCTQNRECRFGNVVNGEMVLNDAGRMVQTVWDQIPDNYPGIKTDAFVIMPNHIHGIIIVGATPRGCPGGNRGVHGQPQGVACPDDGRDNGQPQGVACPDNGRDNGQPQGVACPDDGRDNGQPQGVAPTRDVLSLPDVFQRFKSLTTKYYIDGVKQHRWRPFQGRLWQRNYYEHIIRNMDDLYETREYIANNPLQWEWDRENPRRQSKS